MPQEYIFMWWCQLGPCRHSVNRCVQILCTGKHENYVIETFLLCRGKERLIFVHFNYGTVVVLCLNRKPFVAIFICYTYIHKTIFHSQHHICRSTCTSDMLLYSIPYTCSLFISWDNSLIFRVIIPVSHSHNTLHIYMLIILKS